MQVRCLETGKKRDKAGNSLLCVTVAIKCSRDLKVEAICTNTSTTSGFWRAELQWNRKRRTRP